LADFFYLLEREKGTTKIPGTARHEESLSRDNEKKCLNRDLLDYWITRIPTPDSTTLKK
jgi:hypothetical protein